MAKKSNSVVIVNNIEIMPFDHSGLQLHFIATSGKDSWAYIYISHTFCTAPQLAHARIILFEFAGKACRLLPFHIKPDAIGTDIRASLEDNNILSRLSTMERKILCLEARKMYPIVCTKKDV